MNLRDATISMESDASEVWMAQDGQTGLMVAEPKLLTKRPPFFKVVMINDDYTPMEFVVQVLKEVFRKAHEEAVSIMMDIHNRGAGTCGVYTRDVAETKAEAAVVIARSHEYPLQVVVEHA